MGLNLSFRTGDGCRLVYRLDGPADKPVLVLSNSIGTTHRMWDGQIDALTTRFRVLRYDTRGHGGSNAPAGAYSLDRLGFDVIELLDAIGVKRVHFCGLSLGGFIGQWLAVHVPERIDRLILANTASQLEPRPQWDERITAVLAATDLSETAEAFLHDWFPARLLSTATDVMDLFRDDLLTTSRLGLAGCYAAVRDSALHRVISLIDRPTLVIAGQFDTVTSPAHSEHLASTIAGARLITLPAVHLSNIEQPEAFLREILEFLK